VSAREISAGESGEVARLIFDADAPLISSLFRARKPIGQLGHVALARCSVAEVRRMCLGMMDFSSRSVTAGRRYGCPVPHPLGVIARTTAKATESGAERSCAKKFEFPRSTLAPVLRRVPQPSHRQWSSTA